MWSYMLACVGANFREKVNLGAATGKKQETDDLGKSKLTGQETVLGCPEPGLCSISGKVDIPDPLRGCWISISDVMT